MGRQFKFRAWDDNNKQWLLGYDYPNLGGFSLFGECVLFGEWGDIFWSFISDEDKNFEDLKFTQFVGFTDDKDQDVYEGDILKVIEPDDTTEEYTVYYNETLGRFELRNNEKSLTKLISKLQNPEVKFTVIGNIFENYE